MSEELKKSLKKSQKYFNAFYNVDIIKASKDRFNHIVDSTSFDLSITYLLLFLLKTTHIIKTRIYR
jgi:hypothetical protein